MAFVRRKSKFKKLARLGSPNMVDPHCVYSDEPQFLLWVLPIKIDPYKPCMHHYVRSSINNSIKRCVLAYRPLEFKELKLPCKIIITRIAPRRFDYDNLVASFKYLTDLIADMLIPGLAAGRADGDKRLDFSYDQMSAGKKTYGVKIQIFHEEI